MLKNFRKTLAKKFLDKKEKSNISLDMNKINSVLILRDDNKIGDMIISTILFREIKKKYPHIKIFVLCGKANKIILENNPYVDKIFISHNKFRKDIFVYRELRKLKIGLTIDFLFFRPKPQYLLKLRIINSKFLLGICKDNYNVYDISINIDYNTQHISKIYTSILNNLGIDNPNINYDIFLDEQSEEYGKKIKEENKNTKIIFFNTHSASRYRTLSLEKTKEILEILYKENFKIILNSEYDIDNKNIIIPQKDNFLKVLALVKHSDIILTINTSIIHAANAFNKNLIAIYNNDSGEEKIAQVWAPNYKNAIQLISKGEGINSIETSEIINSLKELWR
ncbi:MAG: glycosyltransferase family 9 protein [Elusimicrobia bacterium]|nr:glycosyltransferase family 9 protein [Elusimicrobiota bacterium]